MKTVKKISPSSIVTALAWILAVAVLAGGCSLSHTPEEHDTTGAAVPSTSTEAPTTAPTEPTQQWETGYVAALSPEVVYCDGEGVPLGTLLRGTRVEYEITPEGRPGICLDDRTVYLQEGTAAIVSDPAHIIPEHTLYVRTAVNLRDVDGRLLTAFADKGAAVLVMGYDYLHENGQAHMYRVSIGGEEGYIMPWYLADNEADALANYDDGSYAIHAGREDLYSGGSAADLDYYPREKGPIEGNEMPAECRALYLVNWRLDEVMHILKSPRVAASTPSLWTLSTAVPLDTPPT